jgi:nucleotide-binding universal stress UspA family protein
MPAELLHVVPSAYFEALARRFPEIAQDLEEALSLAEARVRKALESTSLPVQVLRGFPAQVVAGEGLKSRLVLLGQRGTGTLEALTRGGLARYLISKSAH